MAAFEPHPITGQSIGLPVERTGAAPRPGPVTLKGRYGRLEKLRPDHWSDLRAVFAGHDHVWTYIPPDGPFVDSADFAAFIATRAAADDPYAYAIVDAQDRAVGYFTLLRIVPQHRVIEVGHPLFAGTAAHPARHRSPISLGALRLRHARLSPLRMEVRFAQRPLAAGRVALWICLRGHFPPAHDCQEPQSRRRLVFHAR